MTTEERIEKASKTASSLKTLLVLAAGLVIGGFAVGFIFKERYEDLSKAYDTVRALQHDKWGAAVDNPPAAANAGLAPSQSLCPDGSYMVGVVTSSSNLGPGSIGSVRALCRQLNNKGP